MKLAEALILRADYQKRAAQLRQRIVSNAKVQEGEEPAENPQLLLKEFEQLAEGTFDLIKRINKTNINTQFDAERSLTDALAECDILAVRRKVYADLVDAASASQDRYSRSEIKVESTVSVKEIQKQVDALAKAYRELDTAIQGLNWSTDLVD